VKAIDSNLAPGEVITMREQVDRTSWSRRATVDLLAIFCGMALLLAGIGMYGVMSYAVSQSTRELALRIALGAGPADLLRIVMAHGLGLTLAGVGLAPQRLSDSRGCWGTCFTGLARATRNRSELHSWSWGWQRCWRVSCLPGAPPAPIRCARCESRRKLLKESSKGRLQQSMNTQPRQRRRAIRLWYSLVTAIERSPVAAGAAW
jgi:hypothetical protein